MTRLPSTVVEFIKTRDGSYSKLIRDAKITFGIKIGKSLVSYYKRTKPRIKSIDLTTVSQRELEWLLGLYYADGSKFFEKSSYSYTIKFALDHKRDKDIAERVKEILQKLGLKPTSSIYKGCLMMRVFSKELYSIFPSKSEFYKPKDISAFVSGLIDGDGCARRYSAEIAQTKQEQLMKYLMEKLKFSRYVHKVTIVRGKPTTWVTYYVPSKVCKFLRDQGYCIKLLREN